MPRARSEPTYASVVAKPFPRESYNVSLVNTPTPMEIDTTRHRGPLSEEEKQRRRAIDYVFIVMDQGTLQ